MDFLGPAQPVMGGSSLGLGREAEKDESPYALKGSDRTHTKSCDLCNRQIDGHMRVCPYCHTYLPGPEGA